MTLVCTADGCGPVSLVDWPAMAAEGGQEAADAVRLACPSHFQRNGHGPRTATLSPNDVAALVSGGYATMEGRVLLCDRLPLGGATLLCPECLAPAEVVEPPVPIV